MERELAYMTINTDADIQEKANSICTQAQRKAQKKQRQAEKQYVKDFVSNGNCNLVAGDQGYDRLRRMWDSWSPWVQEKLITACHWSK
jgi:hypothetical protein